jgi:Gram-negative bacterial TonB protein C-terminal
MRKFFLYWTFIIVCLVMIECRSKNKRSTVFEPKLGLEDTSISVEDDTSALGWVILPDSEEGKRLDEMRKLTMPFDNSLYKYIYAHLQYPEEAKRLRKQGNVLRRFDISKEGNIKIAILTQMGYGCDEEAKRVLGEAIKANMDKAKPILEKQGFYGMAFSIFFELDE